MQNNNQPVNPVTVHYGEDGESVGKVFLGLTKREHFAGLALQGLLSSSKDPFMSKEDYARHAVIFADVLLEELRQEND